jgi:hypothetical protein
MGWILRTLGIGEAQVVPSREAKPPLLIGKAQASF